MGTPVLIHPQIQGRRYGWLKGRVTVPPSCRCNLAGPIPRPAALHLLGPETPTPARSCSSSLLSGRQLTREVLVALNWGPIMAMVGPGVFQAYKAEDKNVK